jgi:hypothetical protein
MSKDLPTSKRKTIGLYCLTFVVVFVVLPLGGCVGWFVIGYHRTCWFPPLGPNVQLLVSACERPDFISISTDGRYLLYSHIPPGTTQHERRILDFQTNQSQLDPGCGDLWLDGTKRFADTQNVNGLIVSAEICDLQDLSRTPVRWVPRIHDTMTKDEKGVWVFNPQGTMYRNEKKEWVFSDEVITWFREAAQVYYIPERYWAIAVAQDYKAHADQNVLLSIPNSSDSLTVLKFLKDNHISYQPIYAINAPRVSHNRRHIVTGSSDCPGRVCVQIVERADPNQSDSDMSGRVLAKYEYWKGWWTAQGPSYVGWVYDDSGVVFQLINHEPFAAAGPIQPILRLNIPK